MFSAPAYPEMTGTLKAAGEYDRGRVRVNFFDLDSRRYRRERQRRDGLPA